MKTKPFTVLLILLLILTASTLSAQKADMSGEWKLNKEKSVIADNQLFLTSITIKIKPDSLLTTRVYENGNGEQYPFDENLSLDGKECKLVIYDMPRTSTATRSDSDGTIKISSATTFNGNNGEENMTAKESWKLDNEGQMLTLEFTNEMSGSESTGTYVYDRAK